MAAQDTTPEAILSDLAGLEPTQLEALTEKDRTEWLAGRNYAAQKGWLLDEMSGLLAGAGRDYNAGLVESVLRFYDCDRHFKRSTRTQGLVIVRNSYLSMLGASTPAAMAGHLRAERLWSMGWWPRFVILTPATNRPAWKLPKDQEEPAELVEGLRRLYGRLPPATWPKPPESRSVQLGDGVYDAWTRYNKALSYDLLTDDLDNKLYGTYGRMPAQALKVAQILAALDWKKGEVPIVELRHLARAVTICEEWRASAHRALVMAKATESDRIRERVLSQVLQLCPPGPTLRDLHKNMRDVEPDLIIQALDELLKLEMIREEPWQNPKGGPKTKRYQPN
jgi:hypothetical protein